MIEGLGEPQFFLSQISCRFRQTPLKQTRRCCRCCKEEEQKHQQTRRHHQCPTLSHIFHVNPLFNLENCLVFFCKIDFPILVFFNFDIDFLILFILLKLKLNYPFKIEINYYLLHPYKQILTF